MISIQTNTDSLVAQQNMNINSEFQSKTIQQLTSGYRINSASDDAAGLAVANEFRDNIAELTQGVNNANDGESQLQIMDGGLSNISQILDRMQTLATESSSTTFTGDRTTLNNEYQSLIQEVDRQSANIGLNQGGSNNSLINVYIGGGGAQQSNSIVGVDLSGTANQVDSNGLGLASTNLLSAGTDLGTQNLNQTVGNLFVSPTGGSQTFTVNTAGGATFTATVSTASAAGISVQDALQQLNNTLSAHGMSASIDATTGALMVSSSSAYTISSSTVSAGTGLATASQSATNKSLYRVDTGQSSTSPQAPPQAFTGVASGDLETLTFTSGGSAVSVNLTNANAGNIGTALQTLNTDLASLNISAVKGTNGEISFQSSSTFSVAKGSGAADGTTGDGSGVFANTSTGGSNTSITDTAQAPAVSGSAVGNSLSAVTAVSNALAQLGLVQGRVGAGENTINYAINLAQSQITNFSSAESQIRDADVAADAANLTKAQVLQQASIAAMAQANAEPQAILKLLQG
jgi:flagellin